MVEMLSTFQAALMVGILEYQCMEGINNKLYIPYILCTDQLKSRLAEPQVYAGLCTSALLIPD